jgi:hypothetical protein
LREEPPRRHPTVAATKNAPSPFFTKKVRLLINKKTVKAIIGHDPSGWAVTGERTPSTSCLFSDHAIRKMTRKALSIPWLASNETNFVSLLLGG